MSALLSGMGEVKAFFLGMMVAYTPGIILLAWLIRSAPIWNQPEPIEEES